MTKRMNQLLGREMREEHVRRDDKDVPVVRDHDDGSGEPTKGSCKGSDGWRIDVCRYFIQQTMFV